mmetsp:Transcript_16361/g.57232  ORF Transcript_16361/g.57232 Transcript_16361/m.57232 type:complete len:309 (-) Transcript_16361:1101-2027(-)
MCSCASCSPGTLSRRWPRRWPRSWRNKLQRARRRRRRRRRMAARRRRRTGERRRRRRTLTRRRAERRRRTARRKRRRSSVAHATSTLSPRDSTTGAERSDMTSRLGCCRLTDRAVQQCGQLTLGMRFRPARFHKSAMYLPWLSRYLRPSGWSAHTGVTSVKALKCGAIVSRSPLASLAISHRPPASTSRTNSGGAGACWVLPAPLMVRPFTTSLRGTRPVRSSFLGRRCVTSCDVKDRYYRLDRTPPTPCRRTACRTCRRRRWDATDDIATISATTTTNDRDDDGKPVQAVGIFTLVHSCEATTAALP